MSDTKQAAASVAHTPGPWLVTGTDDYNQHDPQGWPFEVYRHIEQQGRLYVTVAHGIQHEADARLIAAAPDLLEALRDAIPSLQSLVAQQCPDPDTARHDRLMLTGALAAIAKATGA